MKKTPLIASMMLALLCAACAAPPPPSGPPMPPPGSGMSRHGGPPGMAAGYPPSSPCKPGFTMKGGMCVGPHVNVDPDGPDPYRRVENCKPGTTHQVRVPLPDGARGYRLVDQICRRHLRSDGKPDSYYM